METYKDQASGKQPGTPNPEQSAYASSEINLFEVMITLARRKKLIIFFPLGVALVAAAISMLLPIVYTANTKLLPPQQAQSGASALLSQLGGAAALAGIGGIKNPGDVYIGILKSRTVADKLIRRFDLPAKYEMKSPEKIRKLLAKNTNIVSGKDGLITIEVNDLDKKFVAKLANGYVDELQLLTSTLAVTEASQRRLFFERQLKIAKDNLTSVEAALKGALSTGGVISVDSESEAIVGTAARLRAQVSAKEIELGAMRAFVTTQNQAYRRTSEELASLRSELARLEGGRVETGLERGSKGAGLENIQLMRDLKYNQMLYELLAKQYEVARLDEAKDSSMIQVLDEAIEPEFKSSPKRVLFVIVAMMLGLFGAVMWALLSEARQRMMSVPEQAVRWRELQSYLRFR